jgi:hypothetical protein
MLDLAMNASRKVGWRGVASALLRSYFSDLRGWTAGIAVGYAIGIALVVGGLLTVLAAVAVGVIALFHFIKLRLGVELAYTIVAGGLLVLGLVLLLAGVAMMRRRLPSPPRPRRQADAAKQVIIHPAAMRVAAGVAKSVKADPMTQVMAGSAAALLLAWMVGSRRKVRR